MHRAISGIDEFDLWQRAPQPIIVGDTFRVTAGCDKTHGTCRKKFENALNFRGFPHMPGNDFIIRMPQPGRAGARWRKLLQVSQSAASSTPRALWIGTPYRHQASLKGVGCDCLGLLRGVWREVDGREPELPPPYSPDWAEAGADTLPAAARRHLVEIEPTRCAAGDVLLFRWREPLPGQALRHRDLARHAWCTPMTARASPRSRSAPGGDGTSPTRSAFPPTMIPKDSSMATLVLQTVGSVVGGMVGGPARAPWRGARSADSPAPPSTMRSSGGSEDKVVEGPRLKDIDGLTSTEGAPIPRVYGRARIGGQLIWATRLEEVANTEVERSGSQGGKGIGGGGAKTAHHHLFLFRQSRGRPVRGPIALIRRVWADGRELDLTTLTMRVHRGDETQAADPLIVAKEGADNAPAYRGLAYVVFERLPLARFRQPRAAILVRGDAARRTASTAWSAPSA